MEESILDNMEPELAAKIEYSVKKLIQKSASNTTVIDSLVKLYEITRKEAKQICREVLQDIKLETIFDRNLQLGEAVYWYFYQLTQAELDMQLLNEAVKVIAPKVDSRHIIALENVDNVGKMVEKKARLRKNMLEIRSEISKLLRLDVDMDILKAVQTLMASDALPLKYKNDLYELISDFQSDIMKFSQDAVVEAVEL